MKWSLLFVAKFIILTLNPPWQSGGEETWQPFIIICFYHQKVFICKESMAMTSRIGMKHSLTFLYRVAFPLKSWWWKWPYLLKMHAEYPGNTKACNYSCGKRMSNNKRRKCQSWINDLKIPSVTIYTTFHLHFKAACKALNELCFTTFVPV